MNFAWNTWEISWWDDVCQRKTLQKKHLAAAFEINLCNVYRKNLVYGLSYGIA